LLFSVAGAASGGRSRLPSYGLPAEQGLYRLLAIFSISAVDVRGLHGRANRIHGFGSGPACTGVITGNRLLRRFRRA